MALLFSLFLAHHAQAAEEPELWSALHSRVAGRLQPGQRLGVQQQ